MNLLFLDSIDINTFGGYQNWISLMAPELASRGHQVTITGRPKSEFIRRFRKQSTNVKIFELPISGDFNPFTIFKLANRFRKENIDIVICDFNKDVRLGGLAARFSNKPKVIWRLGMDITRNNFVHRFLTPKLIDRAVVPSADLKKQVIESGYINGRDVTVIPHGIPEVNNKCSNDKASKSLKAKYNIPQTSIIAVTSGRFVGRKGHDNLIEAAAGIVDKFPDVVFLLLGDGPLEPMLREKIAKYGLEKHFIFAGMLSDFDLELAGADLMIHPSIAESFGFAVLEGMRAGLPVVACRVGGIPEFAIDGKTAILIESYDTASIEQAVLDFLNSPEKMKAFGQAGKQRWSDDFKLEVMVTNWENYFSNLLGLEN